MILFTAARCADSACDLVWRDPPAHTVYWVCISCICLLIVHVALNLRRQRGIRLKRGRKEWEE